MIQNKLFETGSRHFDDIAFRKHRGSPTSIEANKKANPLKAGRRRQVMDALIRRGSATAKEIKDDLGLEFHQVSGRFSELKANKLIVAVEGEQRDGCQVYRPALGGLT